jgi:hypothetical protein
VLSKIISYGRFLWPEISTNKREMFGTDNQNSVNPALHATVLPTVIPTKIKIRISKKKNPLN